jgi:AcrR family transcriptional regulator
METKANAGVETRRKLLDAAEKLFAERGFDKVSLRDITEAAAANVASVNYHFRNREGLVEEVMGRYINAVNEERLARLDRLEARNGSKPLAPEEILEALVRPFVTQVRRSDLSEKLFYRLMGRMFGGMAGSLPPTVAQGFRETLARFRKVFRRALPGIGEEELLWRMHFAFGAMIHMMAHAETLRQLSGGDSGNPSTDQSMARFVHFAAAGMRHGFEEPAEVSANDEAQGQFLF